jgi:hypothetical protein
MENNWIKVNGEDLTVRQYLKILKKMFKERDLLDKKIEKVNLDDTALIWIEDEYGRYGSTPWNYGIDHGEVVIIRRR